MSRRSHLPFARRSLRMLSAAVALTAILPPPRAAAQVRLTCSSPLLSSRHWDRLSTLLARANAQGTLVVTGPATLVPYRGLERLRDDDFRAEQAVAVLDLTADQGALPRGRYCMTAQRAGTDPTSLAAWTVRYYAMQAGGVAGTPTTVTRGLAYRTSDADATDAERPRPAARFHFVRTRGGVAVPGEGDGLLHRAALVRRQDDGGFYSVWYRCGSGCCGASLGF